MLRQFNQTVTWQCKEYQGLIWFEWITKKVSSESLASKFLFGVGHLCWKLVQAKSSLALLYIFYGVKWKCISIFNYVLKVSSG
jgi:hypothetical protein